MSNATDFINFTCLIHYITTTVRFNNHTSIPLSVSVNHATVPPFQDCKKGVGIFTNVHGYIDVGSVSVFNNVSKTTFSSHTNIEIEAGAGTVGKPLW